MTAIDDPVTLRKAALDDAAVVTAITLAADHQYIARIGRQPWRMTDDYSQ